jgi:hypothetical protein
MPLIIFNQRMIFALKDKETNTNLVVGTAIDVLNYIKDLWYSSYRGWLETNLNIYLEEDFYLYVDYIINLTKLITDLDFELEHICNVSIDDFLG